MKVAVVGQDVTAGFAASAARELGAEVDIYAPSKEPVLPPPGHTYLTFLPLDIQDRHEPHLLVETVWGLDLGLYSLRKWGEKLPTSIDGLFNYMVQSGREAREREVWTPCQEIAVDLFSEASWHVFDVTDSLVRTLAHTYDLVAVTMPVSFTTAVPRLGHTLSLPFSESLDVSMLQLTGLDVAFHFLAWETERHGANVNVFNAHEGSPWLRASALDDHVSLELPSLMLSPAFWVSAHLLHDNAERAAAWVDRHTVKVTKIHPMNRTYNKPPSLNVMLCGERASWVRGQRPRDVYHRVKDYLTQLEQVRHLTG